MEQAAVAAQRLRGRPQWTHRCWLPVNNCIHKPFTWDQHCPMLPVHQPASALENASWFCWPMWLGRYLTILLLLGNSHSQPIKKIKWDLPVLTNFPQAHPSALHHWANSTPPAFVLPTATSHLITDTSTPMSHISQIPKTLRDLQLTSLRCNPELQVVFWAACTTLKFQQ